MAHTASISSLMEQFGKLPLPDKSFAVDLMRRQMIDARRLVLARRSTHAIRNYKLNKVKRGSIDDLKKALDND
jgi:hypothetical protein